MPSNPYGPSDPAKRHSAAMTDGPDRAPARAMLKGVGFTDEDLARPLVGVATTWIETMPCNLNQRELAVHVKAGIREAGGMPVELNTISVSDGVSMGTEGMRCSLVSREVIADSIELAARGHMFDGLVCLVGCDKTIPAAVMALARLDIPGLVLYNGSIAPGRFDGRDVTIQDVFEVVGAHAAGRVGPEEVHALESVACPGAGACGGQFTANTMSMALDLLGISPAGLNGVPATHPDKDEAAATRPAAWRCAWCATTCGPSQIITRDAIDNAIAGVAASGGSTNGVLHLLAIAWELGIPLTIDDFDTIAERTPIVASLTPGGRFVATDLHEAGGVAVMTRELAKAGLVHAEARNVDGRTLGEIAADAHETPGQEVIVPIEAPLSPTGGLAILRGNLAPEGSVVKLAGHERRLHVGPGAGLRLGGGGLRGGQAAAHPPGRRGRDPLRGPRRRPGHARDAARDGGDRRRGDRRRGGPDHRRALLGRHPRPDGRATSPPRPPAAARSRPCARATRSCSTSTPASCGSTCPTTRSPRRLADWAPPPPRYTRGVLAKYAALVSSASEGAVTHPG